MQSNDYTYPCLACDQGSIRRVTHWLTFNSDKNSGGTHYYPSFKDENQYNSEWVSKLLAASQLVTG